MLIIIGYVVLIACVFGGYGLMGGHFAALFQPLEVLIIGGAAVGAFIAGNNGQTIKATLKELPTLLKSPKQMSKEYLDLLSLLYELLSKARKDGMIGLEADVEEPESSAIFQRYPTILKDHELRDFICDYLRMIIGGNSDPFELEALMDHEIENIEHEAAIPGHSLTRVSDALPALGIVAAVLGVVHALSNANLPPAELGALIAHAMVGTFLGILLAYGFIAPLATVIEQKVHDGMKLYACVKVTLLSSLHGYAPQVSIEFGRKVLDTTLRPTFKELDEHIKSVKSGGK